MKDLKNNFAEITGTSRENELGFRSWKLVRGIKKCTFAGVNRSNEIQLYERLGTKVTNGLFEALTDNKFNKNLMLLPVEYRFKEDKSKSSEENENIKFRKVTDYISGMMDTYAIKKYQQFYGDEETNALYREIKNFKKID
ncbi:hypothetical protein [Alkalibacterium kapii]|uniref:hypothetical protein n=1 Tax=Alkalibacterium kapii TaxID=426704 RepID=UPI001FEA2C92|nr:hypothetical protein [Alkalibacterium kapii]